MSLLEIKKYLASIEVKNKLAEIAKWYQIKEDDLRQLLEMIVTGEIASGDVAVTIGDKFGKNFDTSLKLTLDLRRKILAPISEQLEALADELPISGWLKYAPDNLIKEFLAALPNYQLNDDLLQKRFLEAIISWLKDVRDTFELKELLMRSPKVGGLGMPEEIFNQLYILLIDKKNEIQKNNINMAQVIAQYEKIQKLESGAMEDVEIDVKAKPAEAPVVKEKPTGTAVTIDELLLSRGVKLPATESKVTQQSGVDLAQEITEEEEFLTAKKELAPPPPASQQPEISKPKASMSQPQPPIAAQKVEPNVQVDLQDLPPQVAVQSQPRLQKSEPSIRPKVEDVKFSARLFGPIEELESFKVADLRRLSKDPLEAVNKILAKLDLLEDESISKRVEGIKALKHSPLYKVYADIMNQAIREGKSFEQVIEQNPVMEISEFRAIMELNKNLKY
jgi:hypothetical protein